MAHQTVNTNECLVFDKKKNRKSAIKWSSLQFYGIIILVKTKPLFREMAWLPFKSSGCNFLQTLFDKTYNGNHSKGGFSMGFLSRILHLLTNRGSRVVQSVCQSRGSLKDPGSNPAQGMIIYMDEFIRSQLHPLYQQSRFTLFRPTEYSISTIWQSAKYIFEL